MFYRSKSFWVALAIASTVASLGWEMTAQAQDQQQPIVAPKPLPVATGTVRDLQAIEVSDNSRASLTGGVGGENPAATENNPYQLQKDKYKPEDGDYLNFILKQPMMPKSGSLPASASVPLAEF